METRKHIQKYLKFQQVILGLIALLTLCTIFYFWKLGFIDGSRSSALYKANFIYNSFQEKSRYQEVKKLVQREKSKSALDKIEELEKELEFINEQVEVKSFAALSESSQKLKASIANLLSFSDSIKVLNVFNTKLKKFHQYVDKKQWKSLTRMSERVLLKSNRYIERNQLKKLVRFIEKDFTEMTRLTENSVLSRKDKSEVLSRISNLSVEIAMLNKYFVEFQFFDGLLKDTQQSLNIWLKEVAPELTFQKLKAEQIGRYYIMGLIGLLAIVLSCFMLTFPLQRRFLEAYQRKHEDDFKLIFNDDIVEGIEALPAEYSANFKSFISRSSKQFNESIELGAGFANCFPYGALVVNQQLHVEWINSRGSELFGENISEDILTWESLRLLTSLSGNDPVIEVLETGEAKRVPFKIGKDEGEMDLTLFVDAFESVHGKKAIIFVGELENADELLDENTKNIASTVEDGILALEEQGILGNKYLESEFSRAGLQSTFEMLCDLERSKHHLKSLIQEQENSLDDQALKIQQYSLAAKDTLSRLNNFKGNLVSLLDYCYQQASLAGKANIVLEKGAQNLLEKDQYIGATSKLLKEVSEVLIELIETKSRNGSTTELSSLITKLELIFGAGSRNLGQLRNEDQSVFASELNELATYSANLKSNVDIETVEEQVIADLKEVYTLQKGNIATIASVGQSSQESSLQ